jgi:hypothetical protein
MTILENEALRFAKRYYSYCINIRTAKEELDKRLFSILNAKDKVAFLNVLRTETGIKADKHKQDCKNPTCNVDNNYQIALFAIDQELENISSNYITKVETNDKITGAERAELHEKINKVLEQLSELKKGQQENIIGHQIVFEEIDSLREYFDLGKKNWTQLVKGKLFDLAAQNLLERAVVPIIYQTIVGSMDSGYFTLPQ